MIPNPYTYSGYWQDPATKLYHLKARGYDATIGRFLSVDPDPSNDDPKQDEVLNANLYLYTNNNPVTNIDPDGTGKCGWNPKNWGQCVQDTGNWANQHIVQPIARAATPVVQHVQTRVVNWWELQKTNYRIAQADTRRFNSQFPGGSPPVLGGGRGYRGGKAPKGGRARGLTQKQANKQFREDLLNTRANRKTGRELLNMGMNGYANMTPAQRRLYKQLGGKVKSKKAHQGQRRGKSK